MDWFITDRWETPPGSSAFYTERLLRLPDGYVCYSPPPHAPEVGAVAGARTAHVTFGCFNNLAKITPRVIATWAHDPAPRAGRAAGAEDASVLRSRRRRTRAPARSPRTASTPHGSSCAAVSAIARSSGAARGRRHRARPVPLFRRPDHLRGAVDGRADGDAARRELRRTPFDAATCATAGWPSGWRADLGGLRRDRGGAGGGRRRRWGGCAPSCVRAWRQVRSAMRRGSPQPWCGAALAWRESCARNGAEDLRCRCRRAPGI